MQTEMSGKVALVTGGSLGIGRATALAFAREGVRVVIASRTEKTGLEVVTEIKDLGGQATWVSVDVSQPDQVAAMVQRVVQEYGQIDYAFNNAGAGGKGGWLDEIEEEDWDKTINNFLKSVWACMKYEIKAMLPRGGVIVNNSSVDGERAFPMDPVYSAAKHGVLGLTKSAALQYIQRGIRINAICPGWIDTPMTQALVNDPKTAPSLLLHQPIGRFGKPEEVAEAVVWLCSEKSSLIVGTALAVDGGYLAV